MGKIFNTVKFGQKRIRKSGQEEKFDFYKNMHKNDSRKCDIKSLIALDENISMYCFISLPRPAMCLEYSSLFFIAK